MKRVLRFFVQEGWKSTIGLMKMPVYLEEDVSLELSSLSDYDKKPITNPFAKDDKGEAHLLGPVDGWDFDQSKQYHLEIEMPWEKPDDKPFDLNPSIYIPEQLIDFMKGSNVASIGLWNQRGDIEATDIAISQLEKMGIKNIHNRGKYGFDGIIASYIEQQEKYGKIPDGPRVSRVNSLIQEKDEPKKPIAITQGTDELSVLDNKTLEFLHELFKGKVISVSKEGKDLKILVRNYKGSTLSEKE